MISKKLQQLDAVTSVLGTYLIPISDAPNGVGLLKHVTFANIISGFLSQGTFNGASQLVQLTAAGKYPALDGSLITGVAWGNRY